MGVGEIPQFLKVRPGLRLAAASVISGVLIPPFVSAEGGLSGRPGLCVT